MVEEPVATDEMLVEQSLAAENRGAGKEPFCALYERHAGGLCGYLRRMTQCEHTAEDLTQEVFLRVHDRLATFDGRASFKTWLYTIARNLCLDHLRKAKRMKQATSTAVENAVSSDSPAKTAEMREEARRVQQAIDSLPEDQREAVVLVRLGEMKYAEAAGVLGITVDTLRMRVHRGHLGLVKALS